ncbi:MAG: hypothetical protein ABI690_24310 [Chloroflexota bacterium]
MTTTHPTRIAAMIVFAIPAIVLAFVPLLMSIMVVGDMERGAIYAIAYATSGILAGVFTLLVYVARDLHF